MRITSPPYACCNSSSPAARSRPRRKNRKSLSAMWAGEVCRKSLTPKTSNGLLNTGKCRACFPRTSTSPPAAPRRMPTIPRKPSSWACMRGFPVSASVLANRSAFWNPRRVSATSSACAPNTSMRTFLPLNLIPRLHPSRNTSTPKRSTSTPASRADCCGLMTWMP